MGDFGDLGDDLRRKAEELEQRGRALADEMLEEALKKAQDYSSAPPLTAEERKQAPFATKHGAPQMDPSAIHLGTGETAGRFAAGWQGYVEDGEILHVWNDTPEAEYLQKGTETMFARPVQERIEAEIGAEYERRLSDVIADLGR
jgi:hypothetical protein